MLAPNEIQRSSESNGSLPASELAVVPFSNKFGIKNLLDVRSKNKALLLERERLKNSELTLAHSSNKKLLLSVASLGGHFILLCRPVRPAVQTSSCTSNLHPTLSSTTPSSHTWGTTSVSLLQVYPFNVQIPARPSIPKS